MTQDNKISRRALLGGLAALVASPSAAQAFDFLGNNRPASGNTFGVQSGTRQPRQQQVEQGCGTRSSALNQRTSGHLPIYQASYNGNQPVNTIFISLGNVELYHVSSPGTVTVYPIGTGEVSRELLGQNIHIGRKSAWPTWTPTAGIARRLGISQETHRGGPCNPMGAFALYLYEGNRDTILRIHGTNDPRTIGRANVSSGCIRMYNEDVTRLQQSIPTGTRVHTYAADVPGIGNNRRQRALTNG
jgi:lipoprotein-anchoring transpeptidase ErfK/SrfK